MYDALGDFVSNARTERTAQAEAQLQKTAQQQAWDNAMGESMYADVEEQDKWFGKNMMYAGGQIIPVAAASTINPAIGAIAVTAQAKGGTMTQGVGNGEDLQTAEDRGRVQGGIALATYALPYAGKYLPNGLSTEAVWLPEAFEAGSAAGPPAISGSTALALRGSESGLSALPFANTGLIPIEAAAAGTLSPTGLNPYVPMPVTAEGEAGIPIPGTGTDVGLPITGGAVQGAISLPQNGGAPALPTPQTNGIPANVPKGTGNGGSELVPARVAAAPEPTILPPQQGIAPQMTGGTTPVQPIPVETPALPPVRGMIPQTVPASVGTDSPTLPTLQGATVPTSPAPQKTLPVKLPDGTFVFEPVDGVPSSPTLPFRNPDGTVVDVPVDRVPQEYVDSNGMIPYQEVSTTPGQNPLAEALKKLEQNSLPIGETNALEASGIGPLSTFTGGAENGIIGNSGAVPPDLQQMIRKAVEKKLAEAGLGGSEGEFIDGIAVIDGKVGGKIPLVFLSFVSQFSLKSAKLFICNPAFFKNIPV